ncbi:MAG: DUF861 domain-containing protein [Rhizobiales bacterium]|nr:DUF861 domain-containing protein [Hyphomicrobiales bacterium]MBI3674718.1 DUF861 domain-containing protein [Hyphomicrobiales bacterium]
MSTKPVAFAETAIELKPSPIEPSWIIEGQPVARNSVIAKSADRTSCTIVWDCTAGKFNWIYDIDETVHVVEGAVTVDDGHSPPRRLEPGSVAFFPAGSRAVWTVDKYVRKVAFCRTVPPFPFGLAVAVYHALKQRIFSPNKGSLMQAG